MAMFARRVLQAMLFDLEPHIPLEGREKLARELNRQSPSALGFEWELALLYGLSRIGKVEYEAASSGGSQPDIAFTEDSASPTSFTADITTVSDQGLIEQNPIDRFSLAVMRLRQKYKLSGATDIKIEGQATGPHFRDRKMRVDLPPASQVEALVREHVGPMFERVRDKKLATASVAISEPGISATVAYNAKQRYSSVSYPSYRAAYSLTRNPVYPALKAKLDQLKKSGRPGPLGIFLCDGDCELLKSAHSVATVNVEQVVGAFFGRNSSISFVIVLTTLPTKSVTFISFVKQARIKGRIFVNPRAKNPIDGGALEGLLNRVLAQIPAAVATPLDALYWLRHGKANQGEPLHHLIEGSRIMGQSLKVSARKIQEVLAGQMTVEDFWGQYERPGTGTKNPFLRALHSGFVIETVKVTRMPEADDDLIEFEFGPDVAIGKIVAQKPASKSTV
jgi:hypothetical protein